MKSNKLAEIAIWVGATQKLKELSALTALVQKRSLQQVLEIGTWRGGTFWLWCQLASESASLISVDLPGGPFGGGYPAKDLARYKSFARGAQKLTFIRKNSQDPRTVASVERTLKGQPLDLLFIDGDHTYEGVKKDFELYSPFVRKKGLIIFHDILKHPKFPDCQVDKFWKEVRTKGRTWEFLEPEDDRGWGQWGGIGVLEQR